MKDRTWIAIIVCAFGYFVDVYDIILFSAVRIPSLIDIGLPQAATAQAGIFLINSQLVGMLVGGLCWGMLGDKRGRLSVLYGSIILYSTANLANAFVSNLEQYSLLRFIAGFGLAGEFGAGITLASEILSQKGRSYGVTLITTAGTLGGMAGGIMGNVLPWQTAYIVGGLAGFLLLALRWGVKESTLFLNLQSQSHIKRGNLMLFIKNPLFLIKYIKCLLIGLPFWIMVGFFMSFSPEIAKSLQIQGSITAGFSILFFNVGLGLGDISSGILSQAIGSRKKVAVLYLLFAFFVLSHIFLLKNSTPIYFYCYCSLLGFAVGYWVIFMMIANEMFGTNIRATVSVSLPNMVRGSIIPLSFILTYLNNQMGILWSVELIAITSIVVALWMVLSIEETYATNLQFIE